MRLNDTFSKLFIIKFLNIFCFVLDGVAAFYSNEIVLDLAFKFYNTQDSYQLMEYIDNDTNENFIKQIKGRFVIIKLN